jgi:nucleotide-binding universal stress UspA family protein
LAGKQVKPLIVPTNNPLHAVLRMAVDLKAQEIVIGASNKYTAEEQLDMVMLYWLSLHGGTPAPLTVRVISRNRDLCFDLDGGNRIPKISERQARSISELRAAGVGVDRVLLLHDGTSDSHDLFQAVLTMLDPQVVLSVVNIGAAQPADIPAGPQSPGPDLIQQALARAAQLRREVELVIVDGDLGPGLVRLAEEGRYDLIIYQEPDLPGSDSELAPPTWPAHLLSVAPCEVLVSPRRLAPPVTDT